ncbi:MAG: F0F1 ATP synthase subunit B' [Rhodobacteraceae bacterium]|nr:F0F1 ATP synthase subunit B' [Paracoccaceae bacterium]
MATETHDAGHAAAGPAMPQLDFATFPNQIFWLVVTLVVIYLVLSRVALPRIDAILSDRQGTITNDIAAAEDLRTRAKEAEAAYEKALADAKAEAQRIAAEAKAEIQKDLDAAMAKADEEIAERASESEQAIAEIRAGARDAIEAVARDTAGDIVAAMGASADADTVTAAVAERVKG